MAKRPVLAFLLKVLPAFFGLLWLWHAAGLSSAYHHVLAAFLDTVYPAVDPSGVVQGVVARGHALLLKLLIGESRAGLEVNGDDITSNTAMLAALYLSSPILPRWRLFLGFLGGSLAALFLIHAVTVMTFSQHAFIGEPRIAPLVGAGERWTRFLGGYNSFFESMGMYLFVLVLWLPYLLIVLRDAGVLDEKTADPS